MRARFLAVMLLLASAGASVAQRVVIVDQRQRLIDARRDVATAEARANRLAAAASAERDAAARARADEATLAARADAAQASLAAAQARAGLVDDLLARQRARLVAAQAPVARLLAVLQTLARRPALIAIAQPGSVGDLVHVRAVLGSAIPAVRARTAGVRAELAETQRLRAAALRAATALREGRSRLEAARVALAGLEAAHRGRAQALGRDARDESDRALALGEQARDLIDGMAADQSAQATAAELAALPGPLPRPIAAGAVSSERVAGAYRLPVAGQLVVGLDEISPAGVRSRGLSFAVAPGAVVVAPAAGVVRYARAFRGYGPIAIIDHGAGWSSLITGFGTLAVVAGDRVAQGVAIGRAGTGANPRVTVELRRRGRPVDIAALIG